VSGSFGLGGRSLSVLGVWGRGILDLGSVVLCFFLMTPNAMTFEAFSSSYRLRY
jgi:hypothetical protein